MRRKADPALASALQLLRERQGLSQEAVAGEVDISTSSMSRIERALMNPPWSLVRQIADVLGVSISEVAVAAEQSDPRK